MLPLLMAAVICIVGVDDQGNEVWHCTMPAEVSTATETIKDV